MKDPLLLPRLIDSTDDDVVQGLLAAGKRDTADPAQAQRALAKHMAARSGVGVTRSLGPSAGRSLRAWVKGLGTVALAGVMCFALSRRSMEEPSGPPRGLPTGSPQTAAPIAPSEESIPLPSEPAPPPGIPVHELPSATATLRKPELRAASSASSTSSETSTSSLRDELALVEAARSSLAHGEPVECLRTLDAYDRRFRGGLLVQEVAVMRIEALVAHGERDRARALGEAFLVTSPTSAYASRVRSILDVGP